nr:MAG TPA: hypothetical protein [Caudoviricetes sp.]
MGRFTVISICNTSTRFFFRRISYYCRNGYIG